VIASIATKRGADRLPFFCAVTLLCRYFYSTPISIDAASV
jgi:hypothetical protein